MRFKLSDFFDEMYIRQSDTRPFYELKKLYLKACSKTDAPLEGRNFIGNIKNRSKDEEIKIYWKIPQDRLKGE